MLQPLDALVFHVYSISPGMPLLLLMLDILLLLRSRKSTLSAARFKSFEIMDVIWFEAKDKEISRVYCVMLEGILVIRLPLKSIESTGVLGATLTMTSAIVESVRFWFAHETVSVFESLPSVVAVGPQVHGAIDTSGHWQFKAVSEVNGVANESLHVASCT